VTLASASRYGSSRRPVRRRGHRCQRAERRAVRRATLSVRRFRGAASRNAYALHHERAQRADGVLVASVERKSLVDLVASLTGGKLRYQVAELATLPRAALVVEDRYSQLFKLDHVRPAVIADGLAELHIRWPAVPIVFCETRGLAEEWTLNEVVKPLLW